MTGFQIPEIRPRLSQRFSCHSSLVFWVLSRHGAIENTCFPRCIKMVEAFRNVRGQFRLEIKEVPLHAPIT